MTVNGSCNRWLLVAVFMAVTVSCVFAQGETIPPFVSSPLRDSKGEDSFPRTENRILPRRKSAKVGETAAPRKPDPQLSAMVKRADTLFDRYSYSAAFDGYTKAVEYVNKKELYDYYPEEVTHIYMRLGKTAYYLGKYTSGMSSVYDLLCLYPELDKKTKTEALTQLGNYFIRLEKYTIAVKYLNDAMTVLKSSSLPAATRRSLEADIDIALSSAYMMRDEMDQALHYLKLAEKNGTESHKSRIYQNTALNYLSFDNIEKAKEYSRMALETSTSPYERAVLRNNYAILCGNTGDLETAFAVLRENEKEIGKIDAVHVKAQFFWAMSQVYQKQGNDRLALEYLQKQSALLDSIFDKDNEEKQMILTNEFETQKIKNDKTLLEYQLKVSEYESFKKTVWLIVVALAVMLAVTLLILLVKRSRRQKRSLEKRIEDIDADKNAEIDATKREFEEIVSVKSRKLAANTLFMSRVGELVKRLTDELARLRQYVDNPEGQAILKSLRSQIGDLTVDESEWEEFMTRFAEVHPSFFSRLNEKHPGLTAGDRRMCAFILLNLSSKEIAELTHRSVRTVDTTKFRLRKKLDLPKEVSTMSYLWGFTAEKAPETVDALPD